MSSQSEQSRTGSASNRLLRGPVREGLPVDPQVGERIGDRERAGTASSASARTIAAMASPVADWGWAIAQGRQPALSA